MRRLIGGLALATLLATTACGCTTRTDKDKNKDYDKPRSSAKG